MLIYGVWILKWNKIPNLHTAKLQKETASLKVEAVPKN